MHEITSSPTPTPVAERQPGKVADQPATEALIDFEDPDVVSRARLRVLDDSGEPWTGRAVDRHARLSGRAVDRHLGEPWTGTHACGRQLRCLSMG